MGQFNQKLRDSQEIYLHIVQEKAPVLTDSPETFSEKYTSYMISPRHPVKRSPKLPGGGITIKEEGDGGFLKGAGKLAAKGLKGLANLPGNASRFTRNVGDAMSDFEQRTQKHGVFGIAGREPLIGNRSNPSPSSKNPPSSNPPPGSSEDKLKTLVDNLDGYGNTKEPDGDYVNSGRLDIQKLLDDLNAKGAVPSGFTYTA